MGIKSMRHLYSFPSKAKAEEAGYRVDTTTYPWIAYRGPRFQPIAWCVVPTNREAILTKLANDVAKCAAGVTPGYLRFMVETALKEADKE
jgi:hypothetical protein